MLGHVCLVEGEQQGEASLVEDAAGIEHVRHERGGRDRAGGVQDVSHDGREGGRKGLGYDSSRG